MRWPCGYPRASETEVTVQCICRNINCAHKKTTELALEMKFHLDFHQVTKPWQQTLTNGSDVKCKLFSHRCTASSVSLAECCFEVAQSSTNTLELWTFSTTFAWLVNEINYICKTENVAASDHQMQLSHNPLTLFSCLLYPVAVIPNLLTVSLVSSKKCILPTSYGEMYKWGTGLNKNRVRWSGASRFSCWAISRFQWSLARQATVVKTFHGMFDLTELWAISK